MDRRSLRGASYFRLRYATTSSTRSQSRSVSRHRLNGQNRHRFGRPLLWRRNTTSKSERSAPLGGQKRRRFGRLFVYGRQGTPRASTPSSPRSPRTTPPSSQWAPRCAGCVPRTRCRTWRPWLERPKQALGPRTTTKQASLWTVSAVLWPWPFEPRCAANVVWDGHLSRYMQYFLNASNHADGLAPPITSYHHGMFWPGLLKKTNNNALPF